VIFLFADQLRADCLGFYGDPNVKTPHLDELAKKSIVFENAISSCPVCSPARASLLTGQHPLTHGVFLNDVHLQNKGESIADAFGAAGYDTAYIGKWHVDGKGCRSIYIPKERRQGFQYWKVLECTHDYNQSFYYDDEPIKKQWEGYDALAQTRDAANYILTHPQNKPFFLVVSWGTPHEPYHTAPEKYRELYARKKLRLRPNVPWRFHRRTRKDLLGYYSHITAIDDCIATIETAINKKGIQDNTLIVFWSDHGDMLYCHGLQKKQKPWEESIRVPLMIYYPKKFGEQSYKIQMPITSVNLMPTILGLCGLVPPQSVQGNNFATKIEDLTKNSHKDQENAILIASYWPFADFGKHNGGTEYRGVRTKRYTYVRTLQGPWLLYDNHADPFQMKNLCNKKSHQQIQKQLETRLYEKLKEQGDEFLPGERYLEKWGYKVDKSGAVPYKN
jgi:arylsulfatase A-like enzyme